MSGYKFAMGFLAIIISIILWLPLSYVFDLITEAINAGLTNPTVIERNNIMTHAMYYMLFFVILAVVLYIVKSDKGEDEGGGWVMVPSQAVNPTGFRIPSGIGLTLLMGILLLAAAPTAQAWYGSMDHMVINNITANVTANVTVPCLLNGTFNFGTPDYTQYVWVTCMANSTNTRVYYDTGDNTNYVFTDESDTALNMDVTYGNTSDRNATGVWDDLNDVIFVLLANGDIQDASSQNNDGSAQGSLAYTTGLFNSGFDFSGGVNAHVDMGDPCPDKAAASDISLCFWFWGATQSDNNRLFSYRDVGGTASLYSIQIRKTGDAYEHQLYWFARDSATTDLSLFSDNTYNDNAWHHACLVKNGNNNYMYIDGGAELGGESKLSVVAWAGNFAGIDNFHIGNDATSDNLGYEDTLDQIYWLNRNLTYNEVKAIYESGHISFFGAEQNASNLNTTLTLAVDPDPLYTNTDANFTVHYNHSTGKVANISINVSVNGVELNQTETLMWVDVPSNSTRYFVALSGNYSKGDVVTFYVNVTTDTGSTTDTLERTIQNSPPGTPTGVLYPASVIEGDNLTVNVTATDIDGDSVSYWYLFGYQNNTNITSWLSTDNLTIIEGYEGEYLRAWFQADDGEANGTAGYYDMNVTWINITLPVDGAEYIGKVLPFAFNFRTEYYQDCDEDISGTTYSLGYINSNQNHTRTVWYDEDNTYTVTCYSWADPNITYSKTVNFTNYFANWSVSIYTENDWNTPLNITAANLSIFVNCEGGSQYVYNFTGTTFYGVKPECDVQSITAKVDYVTDSYTRERSVPDCTECDIRMYMVDALIYTVLQIPIYMSDYNYYDTRIELYKLSGGNHYTIAQGYFDVERKYVTYLTKDNTYYIRLDQGSLGSEVRDIGYLYAATATAQYLSLSEINLNPSVRLISDNLLMAAAFDNASNTTSTLRITYNDLMNRTTSVRVRIFSDVNNTAWYDNTFYGYDNLTISINGVNTTRHTVHFTVLHDVLGNSPVEFTVGVGMLGGLMDFGISFTWIYGIAAFAIMFMTAIIVVPEIRLPGLVVLLVELGVFWYYQWLAGLELASIAFMIAMLVAGIVFEIKYRGIT